MQVLDVNGVRHMVYAIGSSVVVKNLETQTQSFMEGHEGTITTITVSKDGRYVASGEETNKGVAAINLWDLEQAVANGNSSIRDGELVNSFRIHRKEIVDLAFSPDSKYLASIGGDSLKELIVWDVQDGQAACGTPLETDDKAKVVQWYNNQVNKRSSDGEEFPNHDPENEGIYRLITAGREVNVWGFSQKNKKLYTNIKARNTAERQFCSIAITPNDAQMYLGTRSGEIFNFALGEGFAKDGSVLQPGQPAGDFGFPDPRFKYIMGRAKGQKAKINCPTAFPKMVRSIVIIEAPAWFDDLGVDQYGNPDTHCLVVGGGSGYVRLLSLNGRNQYTIQKRDQNGEEFTYYKYGDEVAGGITSIVKLPDSDNCWIGTDQGNTYTIDLSRTVQTTVRGKTYHQMQGAVLRSTSNSGEITDLIFPEKCSSIFLTSANAKMPSSDPRTAKDLGQIRVWNADLGVELVRIEVPNVKVNCLALTPNGGTILSGWEDGCVRGFRPESGKLRFCINDAHLESGCTALDACEVDIDDQWKFVSGGGDGRLRQWKLTSESQYGGKMGTESAKMMISWKEHKSAITAVKIHGNGSHCLSAGSDNVVILWDLVGQHRLQSISVTPATVFTGVEYHPDMSQVLTISADRRIRYWDAELEDDHIRHIDGSDSGASGGCLTCVNIDVSGTFFAVGSEDKTVKIFDYDNGDQVGIGRGHSGTVNSVKIDSNLERIVSVGSEGAILIWDVPAQYNSK